MYQYNKNENVILIDTLPEKWDYLDDVIVINHSRLAYPPQTRIPRLRVWKWKFETSTPLVGLRITDVDGVEYTAFGVRKIATINTLTRTLTQKVTEEGQLDTTASTKAFLDTQIQWTTQE